MLSRTAESQTSWLSYHPKTEFSQRRVWKHEVEGGGRWTQPGNDGGGRDQPATNQHPTQAQQQPQSHQRATQRRTCARRGWAQQSTKREDAKGGGAKQHRNRPQQSPANERKGWQWKHQQQPTESRKQGQRQTDGNRRESGRTGSRGDQKQQTSAQSGWTEKESRGRT